MRLRWSLEERAGQVKKMIRKGRVLAVDGTVCRESDRKIFHGRNRVTLDGQPVGWKQTWNIIC
ncbi:MAG: hypothetical protein ACLR8P_08765 [Clostridium fessum]